MNLQFPGKLLFSDIRWLFIWFDLNWWRSCSLPLGHFQTTANCWQHPSCLRLWFQLGQTRACLGIENEILENICGLFAWLLSLRIMFLWFFKSLWYFWHVCKIIDAFTSFAFTPECSWGREKKKRRKRRQWECWYTNFGANSSLKWKMKMGASKKERRDSLGRE